MFCGSVVTNLSILTHFDTVTLVACTLFVHSADCLYVAVWYYCETSNDLLCPTPRAYPSFPWSVVCCHIWSVCMYNLCHRYLCCVLSQAVKIDADNMQVRDTATYLDINARNYYRNMGNMAVGAASNPCRRYIRGVWWSRKNTRK